MGVCCVKCRSCGSEWKTDATRSTSLADCPFCQAKLIAEKSSGWQYFDNTKELLAYIATEYGNDALFESKYLSDHFAPLMPQGQKNLLKQAFECGAVKIGSFKICGVKINIVKMQKNRHTLAQ